MLRNSRGKRNAPGAVIRLGCWMAGRGQNTFSRVKFSKNTLSRVFSSSPANSACAALGPLKGPQVTRHWQGEGQDGAKPRRVHSPSLSRQCLPWCVAEPAEEQCSPLRHTGAARSPFQLLPAVPLACSLVLRLQWFVRHPCRGLEGESIGLEVCAALKFAFN